MILFRNHAPESTPGPKKDERLPIVATGLSKGVAVLTVTAPR